MCRSRITIPPVSSSMTILPKDRRGQMEQGLNSPDDRGRPSAWPVYVLCALVGVYSLSAVFYPWLTSEILRLMSPPHVYETLNASLQRWVDFHRWLLPHVPLVAAWGGFGIVAAVGAALFRPWAWWCVVLWAAVFVAWWVLRGVHLSTGVAQACVGVAFISFISWTLMTRRELYFPGDLPGFPITRE